MPNTKDSRCPRIRVPVSSDIEGTQIRYSENAEKSQAEMQPEMKVRRQLLFDSSELDRQARMLAVFAGC